MKPNQLELDLRQLYAQPAFRRWLLHVARLAGIFTPTAGAGESLPFREGQRSLGLDILREAARGQPRGASIEQTIALLVSETNPEETDDDRTAAEPESRRDRD
jgi:hypothetical protein